ncbi:MAG: hypothetical protein LBH42_04935, partial [Treponema sp.]|nr:hypothetical protein [Treponema sp.]
MRKKNPSILIFFVLGVVFSAYSQTALPEPSRIESSDVLPDLPTTDEGNAVEGFFSLQIGVDLVLGNVNADDYTFAGNHGQGFVKSSLQITKSFGPIFLIGQFSDSVGLATDNSYNLFEASLTPVTFIPIANIITGVQFSGTFPYLDGRLVGTVLQLPSATPFMEVAKFGITPGAMYTLPLKWGAVYGSFLLPASRPLSANDWTVQGNLDVGINTALGIGVSVGPRFTFLAMGESVEDVYTCLETGINYTNMKIPLKSAL